MQSIIKLVLGLAMCACLSHRSMAYLSSTQYNIKIQNNLILKYRTNIPRYRRISPASMSSQSLQVKENIPLVEPFGRGLKRDIERKLPHYKSDFIDGLNLKAMSSSFFMFFACLAPAVAFGGLLALATGGSMGIMEAVGATAIGGILYALFSAQPLTIIGTTGPLLAFLKVLHSTCVSNNLPFLPVYAWIGLWSSFLLLISSLFSLSNIVEHITRFTDEIFSTLISIIFIYEASLGLYKDFRNPAISASKSLLSLVVASITYFTGRKLSNLRKTPYLNRNIRTTISDLAPTLGIATGVLVSAIANIRYGITLPCILVPEVVGTTNGRPWLIDLFSLPTNIILLCFFPALMATVLLFMDQNITVRLMMAKENKLKKGSGLHLDMFVVSIVTALTSVLGMPWMVAATVRSLAHLKSLRTYDVTTQEVTDLANKSFEGVQEQRVTGLSIHLLIGASVLYGRGILSKIPQAVITGLFFYLGFSTLKGTDFLERLKLFITDNRDVPKNQRWSNTVSLDRIKLFTGLQASLLGLMWWIKGTSLGVLFPVLIGLLAPIRTALEKFKIFSSKELESLDGEIA